MKKEQAILNTILGLSGFLLGAFLITKIVHSSSTKPNTSKKDVVGKKERKKIDESLNAQKKTMEILAGGGRVTVKELVVHFPGVSTRTLRRDMDVLVGRGYVSQEGSTKSTYYRYLLT